MDNMDELIMTMKNQLNLNVIGSDLEGYGFYISAINTVVYNKNLIGMDERANCDYLNDLLNHFKLKVAKSFWSWMIRKLFHLSFLGKVKS